MLLLNTYNYYRESAMSVLKAVVDGRKCNCSILQLLLLWFHQPFTTICALIFRFFEAALFVVLVAFLLACGIRIFGDYSYVLRSMEISSSGLPPEAMTPLQKEVSNLRAILGGNVLDLKEILGINVLQTDVADLKEGMKELKASVTELRNRIRNRRRELNNNNIIH